MQRAVFSTNEDSLNQTTPEVNDLGPDQIPSLPITGSEDCLYLNVFTPSISIPKKYPVMFYIHGGAFVCGSSYSKFYGPDYILDIEDIVIVATNYRVGPLGFASTEDSVMSGNYGMKDLVLALKWVQENIASYGGNPDSVTIFGGSAGGASVHYLMLSTLAKGLFHRAIPMSGAAHCPWSTFIPGEVANNTQKLASFLNCPTEPSTLLVECLRKVPAEKFIEVDSKFQIFKGTPFVSHVPVVEPEEIEDAFLTENPLTAKSSVPMMIGVTKDEGIMFGAHFYSKDGLALLNTRLNEILPVGLFYDKSSNKPDEITKKIREFYFGDVNKLITKENFKGLIDLHGDSLFVECVSSAVKNHEGTAYLYMFAHKGNVSLVDIAQDDFTKFEIRHQIMKIINGKNFQ
ncbi:esterase E4-like [Lycorma delicatula]|uniref:esterase E4-like n=1 Tax=Lycorma delicatula TaxID=130591 RepID=UPI003F51251D